MFILSFLFCLAVISSLWKKNDGWKNTLLNLLFYCSTWTALSYYSNSFSCDSCPWSWRSTQYAYLLNWDVLEISLEFFNLYIIAKSGIYEISENSIHIYVFFVFLLLFSWNYKILMWFISSFFMHHLFAAMLFTHKTIKVQGYLDRFLFTFGRVS